MFRIRPVAIADLSALFALASNSGIGLTTLPADEAILRKRIETSLASFAGHAERADEMFVFVLEDTSHTRVVGVAAIATAVGLREAWYSYRVGTAVHASKELEIFNQTPTLFLSNDHTGHSELCSLFLAADYRHGSNGSLLSKCRFLFIAQFRERFSQKIIAELRGVSDAAGRSPFWDSLGRRFFSMEFQRADYLTGIGKKSFVAELMPKHPLYTSFLSAEAQAVIGKTHTLTEPARRLLEREGFRYEGHVDIFDAGPTVECEADDIGAVADSQLFTVGVKADEGEPSGVAMLVANTRFAEFRAAVAHATPANGVLALTRADAAALGVREGDVVRAVSLHVSDRGQFGVVKSAKP